MQTRKNLIIQRKLLTLFEQNQASALIFEKISQLNLLAEAEYIAFYQATQGEISCKALMEYAFQRKKQVFLPILAGEKLQFVRYEPTQPLIKNGYGIEEPSFSLNICSIEKLDLVFVPLVAFDSHRHRIGMGKGYYDQSFSFLNNKKRPGKPFLAGLAYEFQKVDQILPNPWDIALDRVITEQAIY